MTGATGYIGGRLVPRLLLEGYSVRCMVRDPLRLQGFPWHGQVEICEGDALRPMSLAPSFSGITTAYYLIHGGQSGRLDPGREMEAALNFRHAAEAAGVQQIIYLGELVDPSARLSPYLLARVQAGQTLREGSIPVTEFRAGMVIGPGSALFEMVRYVAERQPVLFCPEWWFSLAQPIAIADVLKYLVAALRVPPGQSVVIEIGGADRLTYAQMLLAYSQERGFKRLLLRVPFYIPRISAYWVHMVTPIHWKVVLPLIEGLHTESVVRSDAAGKYFPSIYPMVFQAALRQALGRVLSDDVETSWSDSLVVSQGDMRPVTLSEKEGMLFERRQLLLDLPPHSLFASAAGLGGKRGWLYMNWAWEIRGWMDKLIGGVGLRRGRRHPDDLRVGESLDFWRVEAVEPDRLIRLRAEMKVPGKAWLEFRMLPQPEGKTLFTQTAWFAPRGLGGLIYWYSLYPIHGFIFSGMIRAIAARALTINNLDGREVSNGKL